MRRRQPPSGRQAAFLHVACKFSLHTQQNFVANPRCNSSPIPQPPFNHALVLRHCLSSLLAYFAYFAIQFLFFICAFFCPPSHSVSLSIPLAALQVLSLLLLLQQETGSRSRSKQNWELLASKPSKEPQTKASPESETPEKQVSPCTPHLNPE